MDRVVYSTRVCVKARHIPQTPHVTYRHQMASVAQTGQLWSALDPITGRSQVCFPV